MKQPRDEFGNPIALWPTKEEARQHRATKYADGGECLVCGYGVFFVKNDQCWHCALIDAIHLYSIAINQKNNSPTSQDVLTALMLFGDGTIPINREQALESGHQLYVTNQPCRDAGHLGVRNLKGDCFYCETERNYRKYQQSVRQRVTPSPSPRQEAIAAGLKWYNPLKPCKRCGKRAPRRVDNGICKGCQS